jgi:hypothetical protein
MKIVHSSNYCELYICQYDINIEHLSGSSRLLRRLVIVMKWRAFLSENQMIRRLDLPAGKPLFDLRRWSHYGRLSVYKLIDFSSSVAVQVVVYRGGRFHGSHCSDLFSGSNEC